jgi:hypothetical protein
MDDGTSVPPRGKVPSVTKNQASEHVWALRPAAMVVAFVAMVVAALLAATPAWASSPSGVSLQFYKFNPECGCAQRVSTTRAGEEVGYKVSFTATSALSGGSTANDSITISAPAGTVFPASGYSLTNITTETGYSLKGKVVLSAGGSTVTIPLAGNEAIDIRAGDRVSVAIGFFGPPFVTNPSEPGQYTLGVSTSSDTTPATSDPYTILPALVGGPPPVPEGPTSKEQCKKGGYEEFGFKNQGQCVAFVERGPKNKGEVPSS